MGKRVAEWGDRSEQRLEKVGLVRMVLRPREAVLAECDRELHPRKWLQVLKRQRLEPSLTK